MRVKVLGAAAGGGFPQWNCRCPNCEGLRHGTFAGSARSQTQLAVSADGVAWFLVGASPDLRTQIESCAELNPRASTHANTQKNTYRHSPIQGVVLTSAEVDSALGLLIMREWQPLRVYATESVRRILIEDNAMFDVLNRQPGQVQWESLVSGESIELRTVDGAGTGVVCTAQSTGGGFPGYVPQERAAILEPREAVLGLFLEQKGRQLAFFPGAVAIEPAWLERMAECDAILLDGTFWSGDELIRLQSGTKTARSMGHLPVGDADGALAQLKDLKKPRKIFIHINNTNPMLNENGAEYRRVRDAGWELATDGMELQL